MRGYAGIVFIGLTFIFGCSDDHLSRPASFVDPFIGTGGHGHTYPGASLPFGMVQLSPDTRLTGWDGCAGYHYSDPVIYGFSHTHLSGTGIPDYGDILFLPFTGKIFLNHSYGKEPGSGYGSRFSHEQEKASPGYYSVRLVDYNIDAELTATRRTGFHKYTFPANDSSFILVDLQHRDKVLDSKIRIINNLEIEGYRQSQSWADNQHVYFVARFSEPFTQSILFLDDSIRGNLTEIQGQNVKAVLRFKTGKKKGILVKVGLSAVSTEGARKNLEQESSGWDFSEIRDQAEQQWNRTLGRIEVKGGTKEHKTVFYTALYHALLNPNLFSDVDGSYRGMDHKIYKSGGFDVYTVFSLWDTYRAAHPLMTILEPRRTGDFINTFLSHYQTGGMLPVWELAANETWCMIGYHSVSVIADAYLKGIRDFDAGLALEAMVHSARQNHFGLGSYRTMGFIPANLEGESVSRTLEYAYDDWCIAMMARELKQDSIYREFIQRAQYFKNLFDPSTGFMRARMNGFWFQPFDPREVNFNYTEANAWQYSFYVPQDVDGLIGLLGGETAFETKLDELFCTSPETTGWEQADITGLIGQYAHGNEPSHHMAYLYNYVGKPWKTQQRVRQILDEMYHATPEGLCGNEDCGQMSAWYVMSAMGFYPVCPGLPQYVIGSPVFDEVVIHLENGNNFRIISEGNSPENKYIQSVSVNGTEYSGSYFSHEIITEGGLIVLRMGPQPGEIWGTRTEDRPTSAISDLQIIPVPFISEGTSTFADSTLVRLGNLKDGAEILYTQNGSDPKINGQLYREPIMVNQSATFRVFARKEGSPDSFELQTVFKKIPPGRSLQLRTSYSNQYAAGGALALIDLIRGGNDFKTGTWQGYQGVGIEAIVDLGKGQYVRQVLIGFLQDNNAWIFMPEEVLYFISSNGSDFNEISVIDNIIPPEQEGVIIRDFTSSINRNARYIKVIAKNRGICPPWHKGAGGSAWIFADEIVISQ
jgi:predicted alpha-1,2-mannosidase